MSMLIIFSDVTVTVHKELTLVGQTFNSAYYCDIFKRMCEDFLWNLATKELAAASRQHTVSHLFYKVDFDQKPHDCYPQTIPLSWLGPLWLFLISHHFHTTEVKEAKLHAALNTLREHNFQDVLGMVHMHRRRLLWGWQWLVGPKLVFDQMAALK
jgi:hypothetical protein